MTEKFGQTSDIKSIRHYAVDTQRVLAYMLVPLFLGAAFYLVPVLIRHALPEFEPAIPVVHIIVAASFLIALVSMPLKLLNTAGYRWGITAVTFFCLLVNAAATTSQWLCSTGGSRGPPGPPRSAIWWPSCC